jgi:eukaryotic-like serine/threonine-protein kinase
MVVGGRFTAVTELQGQILAGRYELDRVLGAGGMATVYLAADNLLKRQVAVKVLDPSHAWDPSFVERFRAEARTAAALSHPNIVTVFDSGSDNGLHYLVMEHVPGESLAALLRRQRLLPPQRAAELAGQVCAALQAAHDHGVVHRDVKPGNVLLAGDGRVKVCDFGIAKTLVAPGLTAEGMVLGTAAYLSPEQAQGRPVDARSDVYALGCLLHELLTGAPPFGSGADSSPVAVAVRQVSQPPEPPSRRNPQVDPWLDAVVLTAMAKHPDQRHPSARAMGSELARVLAGQAAEAETGELQPPTRLLRRRPLRAALAAAGLQAGWAPLALLAGITLAMVAALLWPHGIGAPDGRAQATPISAPASISPQSAAVAPPTATTRAPSQPRASAPRRGQAADTAGAVQQRQQDKGKDNGKRKGKG